MHQEEHIELLHDVHVKTFTTNTYSDIIGLTDKHYTQMSKRAKPIEVMDCSTQQNPNYWLKTLMSKSDMLQHA